MKIWFAVALNVFVYFSLSLAQSCSHDTSPTPQTLRKQDGGLAFLLSSARNVRKFFFGTNVEYDTLRNTVSLIYNGSTPFNEDTLFDASVQYLSTNLVYSLIALVLSLSLLLPLLLLFLFCYWEKCSHSHDEERYEDVEQRHSSLTSQCVSWGIALCSLFTIVPLFTFVIISLIGTERISQSLSDSVGVVNQTLPELVDIHNNVLSNVQRILQDEAQFLNNSFYTDHIYPFSGNIKQYLNNSLYDNVTHILYEVSGISVDAEYAGSWALGLLEFERAINNETDNFIILLDELSSLMNLCSNYVNSSNHLLSISCQKLVGLSPPPPSSVTPLSLSLFNASLLQTIVSTMEETESLISPLSINGRIYDFNEYLSSVEDNVSDVIFTQFHSYLHPLVTNMSIIADHIHTLYSPITYDYPQSQVIVEKYLGPNYLSNVNEFQVIISVSFSLSLFVLLVGVILTVVYGLINIIFIYLYGEDSAYIRASHQAGLVLKKLSCWLSVSGIVSAIFFIFTLCLASLLGRSCGVHGNYTELIDEVIDKNQSWGDVYPLGSVYHSQPSYPLTLHSVLTECSMNASAVDALQLKSVMKLDQLEISNDDYIHQYVSNISNFAFNSFHPHSLLGTNLQTSLHRYLSLNWSNSSSPLPINLFQPLSIEISNLQDIISNISYALDNDTLITVFNNSLTAINSALPSLVSLDLSYNSLREELQDNSSLLSEALGRGTEGHSLLDHVETEELNINRKINRFVYNRSCKLATDVIGNWNAFSLSSANFLSCSAGRCYPLYRLFHQFTDLVCGNLLTGLDVYWISVSCVFILSLFALVLLLLLSSRLLDPKLLTQQTPVMFIFSFVNEATSQFLGVMWLSLVYGINIWLVVAIATDDHLCEGGDPCCPGCWGTGVALLLLSFPFCVSLRVYQWIMLHRLRVYEGVKAQSVQRYWMKKINATLFYSQLVLFFTIHVPFLAISGAYINSTGILTGISFLSCSLSLVGMAWMVLLLILERKELLGYMSLLQDQLYCCRSRGKFIPTPVSPDVPVGGVPNGVITSQPTDEFNETEMGVVNSPSPPIRLGPVTVLPHLSEEEEEEEGEREEETEFGPERVNEEPIELPTGTPPPPEEGTREEEEEEEEESNREIAKRPSLWLDRRSEERDGQYIRTDPNPHSMYTGVEVAPSSCQQSDTASTPRSSIYTSHESVTYHSSAIPGYTSTDDSSYKDGYESYDSEPSYPPYIPPYIPQFGSVRVDV
ncbi:PREDICTED: uncharacterized protein LOC100632793 [Amphimedon queenslandica]|uniref:G-protein coupled receptors family 2 profile 2 domain-containing protein n=1 Tax=Amphimedon queenslandica TaxID=400682 RepID=A0A1X7UXS0_AMPQE|nr:PREDICTED: uncharacterized protein LOC100632793 [Amphimedon queenslandica]|eukprot:XP_019851748.1 PREDICTED: uncharacterized protein LOC100632793 [Amphimedon queenslandica]